MPTLEQRLKDIQAKLDKKKRLDEAKKNLDAAKAALKKARGK